MIEIEEDFFSPEPLLKIDYLENWEVCKTRKLQKNVLLQNEYLFGKFGFDKPKTSPGKFAVCLGLASQEVFAVCP